MQPKSYLRKISANVSKRCGIARATVEVVLPAFIDEIRHQLCEGSYPCVPIEGFGTFAVIDKPEHEYLYNYKGANRVCKVAAKKQLKFAPTRNMKRELLAGKVDPTRKSFSWHPDDPKIRKRNDLRYRKGKFYSRKDGACSRPIPKSQTAAEPTEPTAAG